ncbi:MAG: NAD(P)H-dependent oxidoreductase [Gammaproteobacteria bacterium]|nr:NAD(P)H-dependent oxidoreductase [Gammaproteobacteria bacterium]MCP4091019.1 NAD(P)H-dependent oxidoreductase [Gammaproteobacteria bacterium]MCP4277455.1 NAD(P)H-dependent oxidoreductase [Gammaproteobacteria bacterium]MCP4831484.1 NAD(P)H-dependent oxidoreductase [Gammaproteobacteria bacterium]MCP4927707.1 NAD(P)H-dependent oxidoreductase [Gammaproteobacteria bacterium]
MRVLIVYAHPEPASFNGALRDVAKDVLCAAGHEVMVSDLYAQGFAAVAGPADVVVRQNEDVFNLGMEQMHASQTEAFSADVQAELDKLMAADVLILQFPMWWFSMPAILKGWVDRVFAFGSAYDFGRTWENGVFAGRKAMLSITASAPEAAFKPDGRNGDMERVLWPIHAGILALCGYSVLPPFIAHGIPFIGEEAMQAELERYKQHLLAIDTTEALFFHADAEISDYRLAANIKPTTPGQHRGPRWHLPE